MCLLLSLAMYAHGKATGLDTGRAVVQLFLMMVAVVEEEAGPGRDVMEAMGKGWEGIHFAEAK